MTPPKADPEDLPYALEKLPRKATVGAEAFFELDLRAGRVVSVEEFPEALKPSYKLRVDFGPLVGELQSSAQVTNYEPSALTGRLVVGAINLGSKRIVGFESEFLILGAMEADGTVQLLELPASVAPGAPIA